MFTSLIARLLRAAAHQADQARSRLLLLWLKSCFPGLRVGRHVYIGAGTRVRILNGATLSIGDRMYIEPRCLLVSEGSLTIGPDSFLGAGSVIVAVENIEIGADALIAPNVSIRDQDHRMADPSRPYRLQGQDVAPVTIGSNVWLGTNAVVLKGVTIGDNAVVAAAGVVTRSVPAFSLVAGVPARVLKTLDHQTSNRYRDIPESTNGSSSNVNR